MNFAKHLGGKTLGKAFSDYEARNFYRAYCRSAGSEVNRKLFASGALPEANGKYEPFVIPTISRAIEAFIGRQIIGMNMLYPPGNYSMLGRKFRKSELSKSASPVHWGYARIRFDLANAQTNPEHYLGYATRRYTQWNKRMSYKSYRFAPHKWLTSVHTYVLNTNDMEKIEKSRMKWDRKPWVELLKFDDMRFLLAMIAACVHDNMTFLDEILAGDHTYMDYVPKISASA